jgi:hypothetical protein
MDIIIGAAPDVQAPATGDKHEFDFFAVIREIDAREHRHFGLFDMWRGDWFPELLFQVLPLKLFFELSECGLDRDTFRKDVYVRLNRHRRHRAVTVVVYVIDGRRQDLSFEALRYLRRRFRMRAPFHLEF